MGIAIKFRVQVAGSEFQVLRQLGSGDDGWALRFKEVSGIAGL